MRKKIISIMLCNCLILGALLGCGAKENQDEPTADEPMDDRGVDLTDYSSYLRKVWCMNGENTDSPYPDNNVPVSLVITQIEEGSIQGYFDNTAFVYADYFRLPQFEKYAHKFYGTIYDGTAECRCDFRDGREGTLTITFCVDDRIEAVLDGNDEKRCLLRPYHITDANYFHAYLYGETIDFETKLGIWGTVTGLPINMNGRYISWKTGSLSVEIRL